VESIKHGRQPTSGLRYTQCMDNLSAREMSTVVVAWRTVREYRQWYYRTRKHWSRPTTFLAKFRYGWNNQQNYDDTTTNNNTLTTHLQTFTDNQGSKTLWPDVSLQEYLGYCTTAEQHSDMLQRHHSTSWSLFSDVIEIVSDSGSRILISIHPNYS
jgi:hypothetical protein